MMSSRKAPGTRPSFPRDSDPNHRAFLIRSLDRCDQDLAALQKVNRSLHEARNKVIQQCGESVLLDMGRGRLTLAENMERLQGDDLPENKDVCIDFLLRMRLRRKLLNRLARRLNRASHAMDGEDVTPPGPPKYGDLRLFVDPSAVKEYEKRLLEKEEAKRRIKEAKEQQEQEEEPSLPNQKEKEEPAPKQDDKEGDDSMRIGDQRQEKKVNNGIKTAEGMQQPANDGDRGEQTPADAGDQETVKRETNDAKAEQTTPEMAPSSPVKAEVQETLNGSSNLQPQVDYYVELLKDYKDTYEKKIYRSTGVVKYSVLDQEVEEDHVAIKYGAGIGASHRSMSSREKEAEWKRWQIALLGRVPDQPTFKELGLENRVFKLQERLDRLRDNDEKEVASSKKSGKKRKQEESSSTPKKSNKMAKDDKESPKKKSQAEEESDDEETDVKEDEKESDEEQTDASRDEEPKTKMQTEGDSDKEETEDMDVEEDEAEFPKEKPGDEETKDMDTGKDGDKGENDAPKSKKDDQGKAQESKTNVSPEEEDSSEKGGDEMETEDAETTGESDTKRDDTDELDNEEEDEEEAGDDDDEDYTEEEGDKKDGDDSDDDSQKEDGEDDDDESKKTNEESILRKKSMSLAAVPSFYDQDMRRVRLIHADLMATSIHEHARQRIADATNDYNYAFRQSNEIYNRRVKVQAELNNVLYEARLKLSKLKNDYALEVAIARSRWQKRKEAWNAQKLQSLMPVYMGRPPIGTPGTVAAASSSDPVVTQVATTLSNVVDAIVVNAESGWKTGEFEPFVAPPTPSLSAIVDHATGQSLEQKFNLREASLRADLTALTMKLQGSEEERKRAWKKMLKTRAEFEMPNQQWASGKRGRQVDPNQLQLLPVPPLRASAPAIAPPSVGYASSVPAYVPPSGASRSPTVARVPYASTTNSKYSVDKVKERIAADGSVAPVSLPKKNKDGLYQRPAGRTRKGMEWDAINGIWVPASH